MLAGKLLDNLARNADDEGIEGVKSQINHIEQEARMVFPGIQTLFGFQLIAVFSAGFNSALNHRMKVLHLCAMVLVMIATALLMAPAAYHRQAEPRQHTRYFANLSSRLLTWAMVPMALGICLDFYLICRVITGETVTSFAMATVALLFFSGLWFVFPQIKKRQNHVLQNIKL